MIATRIALEAKRLLVHTSLTVALIADELGFDDPSNFVKFFRREVGCAPIEVRARYQPADLDVRNAPSRGREGS